LSVADRMMIRLRDVPQLFPAPGDRESRDRETSEANILKLMP